MRVLAASGSSHVNNYGGATLYAATAAASASEAVRKAAASAGGGDGKGGEGVSVGAANSSDIVQNSCTVLLVPIASIKRAVGAGGLGNRYQAGMPRMGKCMGGASIVGAAGL